MKKGKRIKLAIAYLEDHVAICSHDFAAYQTLYILKDQLSKKERKRLEKEHGKI